MDHSWLQPERILAEEQPIGESLTTEAAPEQPLQEDVDDLAMLSKKDKKKSKKAKKAAFAAWDDNDQATPSQSPLTPELTAGEAIEPSLDVLPEVTAERSLDELSTQKQVQHDILLLFTK